VLDDAQRDAEAADALASPGGAELKNRQGPLDNQDSCSARASLRLLARLTASVRVRREKPAMC
jgi:hypothetical protein